MPENASPIPDMTPGTFDVIRTHALNGAQRAADAAKTIGDLTFTDYLEGRRAVDFAKSLGARHVTESGSGRSRVYVQPGEGQL